MLIGAVIITKTNREITVAYYWKSLISNLITVDSNINFLIKTAYAETNFDNVMALGEKFEKDLNDILKIDSLDTISLVGIDLADVQRLKTMFSEKFDYIYTYNYCLQKCRFSLQNIKPAEIATDATPKLYFRIPYRMYFSVLKPCCLLFIRYTTSLFLLC